jgi:hypothetical protein
MLSIHILCLYVLPFLDYRTSGDEDLITFKNMFLGPAGTHPKRNGFYIEMGAFDGVQESNTRMFELCLGWKGLLIEASPRTFEKLIQNRVHNHMVNAAPSCSTPGVINMTDTGMTNSGITQFHAKDTVDKQPTKWVHCMAMSDLLEEVRSG